MKDVAVEMKGNPPQRSGRVDSIARMPFAQVRAQQPILNCRENPVSDDLVERHASPPCISFFVHPRPEDGVRLSSSKRLDELRQALGRVLPIPVNQRDEIESPLNGVMKADLLITTVALVFGIPQDRQREWQRLVAVENMAT